MRSVHVDEAATAHQKLMALPKEAARLASLKASDTVWRRRRTQRDEEVDKNKEDKPRGSKERDDNKRGRERG